MAHVDTSWATEKGGLSTLTKEAFDLALPNLRAAVGAEQVLIDSDARAHWSRTTLTRGTHPRAVVRPSSTAEVQAVMRIADHFGLQIHPVSTGCNWGYGDACAVTNGQLILELKRMDRILEVNEELAYVTVEPGVTQGRIAEHLETQKMKLWMDATGAGPQTSLIGNTLERGFGHTPHGDRFAHACGFEVVLPDGRLLKTGFGHYANAKTAQVYPYGIGPSLDGLFTQSNFGVVTKMTFWLMPKPEAFQAYFFFVERDEDIGPAIEALRPLRQRGTIRTPVHIGNDLRVISLNQAYPWEAMRGLAPLSPGIRADLRRVHGVRAWTGSGAICGSKAEVAAAVREIKRALGSVRGVKRVIFLDDGRMRLIDRGYRLLRRFGMARRLAPVVEKLAFAYDLLKGKSPPTCTQGGLWRVRTQPREPGSDPRDHGAGFFWISPVLPMTRRDVQRVNTLAEAILNRHGFDYLATLSMVNGRALCAILTIAFDKRNREESVRARRCHDELLGALLEEGYPPYRAGNLSMGMLDRTSDVFFELTARLKTALDPRGLLSPGHYEPLRARLGSSGLVERPGRREC